MRFCTDGACGAATPRDECPRCGSKTESLGPPLPSKDTCRRVDDFWSKLDDFRPSYVEHDAERLTFIWQWARRRAAVSFSNNGGLTVVLADGYVTQTLAYNEIQQDGVLYVVQSFLHGS